MEDIKIMSAVMDVHGVDEDTGTHISVFVYMASDGQFDALEFPFKGTVTIELLNQLETTTIITSLSILKQTLIVKTRVSFLIKSLDSMLPRTVSISKTTA